MRRNRNLKARGDVERRPDKTHSGRVLTPLECSVCDALYDIVRERKMQVQEVAEALGVSGSAVGQVLNRKYAPSLRTIENMAEVLGHSVRVVLDDKDLRERIEMRVSKSGLTRTLTRLPCGGALRLHVTTMPSRFDEPTLRLLVDLSVRIQQYIEETGTGLVEDPTRRRGLR